MCAVCNITSFSFLLLNPPKIVLLHFHCKRLTITLIFAFCKEYEGKVEIIVCANHHYATNVDCASLVLNPEYSCKLLFLLTSVSVLNWSLKIIQVLHLKLHVSPKKCALSISSFISLFIFWPLLCFGEDPFSSLTLSHWCC